MFRCMSFRFEILGRFEVYCFMMRRAAFVNCTNAQKRRRITNILGVILRKREEDRRLIEFPGDLTKA